MNIFPGKKNGGYTLVEMLVYLFMLVLLLLVIVNMLFAIITSQRNIKTSKNVEMAAAVSLERIVREIRNASSVDVVNSTLGSNPGVLQLNTTDISGNSKTVQFFASSTILSVKENGVYTGPLTPSNVALTNLIFRQQDSGKSKAVKIEMTFQSGSGNHLVVVPFYSTAILRNSY